MLLKQTILNIENIEFELHSVQSSIEYFRALLDAPDEIVMKSLENVVDRTIGITGEYVFETYHASNLGDDVDHPVRVVVAPGPRNTIVEADWETDSVYIYCRGKFVATSVLVQKRFYKFSNEMTVFDLETSNTSRLFPHISEKINASSVLASRRGKKGLLIITNNFEANMYDFNGELIHKYDTEIVKELYKRCQWCIILSDGISVCFQWGKFGKNFYRVVRPL